MPNKITIKLLTKNEASLVSGGWDFKQECKNLAGGVADALGSASKNLDRLSGNPQKEKIVVVEKEVIVEIPSDAAKTLEKYDWCHCGYNNGTSHTLKIKQN